MNLLSSWLLMMKMAEGGVSLPHLYRWLHQVSRHIPYFCLFVSLAYSFLLTLLFPSVTVFTENMPSDSGDNLASQSVPMVTASTGMAAAADDGDEVFMEHEGEG